MFKLLAALLAMYIALALCQGEVYARRHAWGELISRETEPRRFWTVIAIYTALAIALATVF